jgi:6-phosphofructokinase 1
MHIGVLTSGGDSPGMNACVRAIVRTAVRRGISVTGVRRGYIGIAGLPSDLVPLTTDSVSNILQRGGTIIKSGRCMEMLTAEGVDRAADTLRGARIDALLAIGGNGTMAGLSVLTERWDGHCVLLPGTIDNDVGGTDWAIGYDTALNTALEAIDRIRDTAEAFDRVFLVEVMGRDCGALAIGAALAGGAEEVIVPETKTNLEDLAQRLTAGQRAGRGTSIVVVSEHDESGSATEIAAWLTQHCGIEVRVCVLGHVQRGGSPTAGDRILASRLGIFAVDLTLNATEPLRVAVGVRKDECVATPLLNAMNERPASHVELATLAAALSR